MNKPSIHIAMPCYDMVKINTMISMLKLIKEITKAGISFELNTMKSPYVAYARNILSSRFLIRKEDYLLFVDADLEFEPECVIKMLLAQKDIICAPYRAKTNDPNYIRYTVNLPDPKNVDVVNGVVEILNGPAGMMLIKRKVFEKIIEKHPELLIKQDPGVQTFPEDIKVYNFFHCNFKDNQWTGEDMSFCDLARSVGFKVYAHIDSTLIHHGSYGYKGSYKDIFKQQELEALADRNGF